MVEPGQVLAGKFQIERVLGQGGMGVVVAAQHLQLGQLVALKFLLPEAMRNPETTERFLREARASVRLKSEHVGRVIDVGTLDTGSPYIVMEYLDGQDLDVFRKEHTRLPVVQVVDFVLQASEAVAEAHSIGIIHRDLKPANLFLTVRADGTPTVKVLDFGISKATQSDQDFSLTRTATVMGSPGYMSPEQLRSARDVDARTDVWAMGVILFELVSGRAPFEAEAITELTLKVAMDPTPPLDVAGLPPGFEDVVRCCLEKDPNHRYGSIAELAAALAPFGPPNAAEMARRIARVQAGLTTHTRQKSAVGVALAPTTLSGSTMGRPGTDQAAAPKKRVGLWVGIGAAVLAVAVAAIVITSGGGAKAAPSGGAGNAPATGAASSSASGTTAATGAAPATAIAPVVEVDAAPAPMVEVDAGTGMASGAEDGSARDKGRDKGRDRGRDKGRDKGTAGASGATGASGGTAAGSDFGDSRF